jgi:hypothetical protein
VPEPSGRDPVRMTDDQVIRSLRGLSATLVVDAPRADLDTAVLDRLHGEPTPRPRRAVAARVSDLADALRRRWRASTAVAIAVLLALVAVTPAGAKIREWLGLGGVVVVQEPAPSGAAPDPGNTSGQQELTLDEARSRVAFPLVVPLDTESGLGTPSTVTISLDDRIVTMIWADGDPRATGEPAEPVRLDQFAGYPDFTVIKKYADDVRFTSIDGADAFWLRTPHPLVYTDAAGAELPATARTSGPSLIWVRGGVTLRLEGIPDMTRAVQVARSIT